MPAFEYSALDAEGRRARGVLQADTARAARTQLRERGLNPLSVEETRSGSAPGARRIGGAERALLMRQLSTLVASGLPIDESLAALAEGSEGRLRSQVMALRARVLEGSTLAAAMAEFPGSFPALYRASVAAGEAAGKLDAVLLRLADYAESRDALSRRVLLALTYPLLLSTVAIAVVTALMIWVVPQVIGVFSQFGQALPLPTRILVALSAFIESWGGWLALLLVAAVVALGFALRQPGVRAALDRVSLRIPVWGRLARAMDTARFARTLALLTAAAVPLLEALSIASQVVQNQLLREALARASLRVREGQALSRALADSGQFPPVALRLIASGERSGRLDAMLGEAAAQQERELDTALGVAMAALGPGVILLVGGLVLFVVLAILLPIFQINTLIR
ncbi:MAG: type II secretion system inner membrane protein GspF [Aquimonas sp.]|nr:type II secretion system inner membrane protein GspF [Aquimonas sp.]